MKTRSPLLQTALTLLACGLLLLAACNSPSGPITTTPTPTTSSATCGPPDTVQISTALNPGDTLFSDTGENITSVVWSPNEQCAAVAYQNTIKIFDIQTRQESKTLTPSPGSTITALAWSPDNRQIAAGLVVNTTGEPPTYKVQIWDVASGQSSHYYSNYTQTVFELAWAPNASLLASSGGDGVEVWNPTTGQEQVHAGTQQPQPQVPFAWSPDSLSIASGNGDQVEVWPVERGKADAQGVRQIAITDYTLSFPHQQPSGATKGLVSTVAWSSREDFIASGDNSGQTAMIQVWDAKTGDVKATYMQHTKAVTSLAWSPGGAYLASGSLDGTVQVWTPAGTKTYTTNPTIPVNSSSTIFTTPTTTSTTTTTTTFHGHEGDQEGGIQLAWSPDGQYIASISLKRLFVWQAVPTSPMIKELLAAQNFYRDRVSVPLLAWSDPLSSDAQPYATYLAKYKLYTSLPHDGPDLNQAGVGENLYGTLGASRTFTHMVNLWASEGSNYTLGTKEDDARNQKSIGHYTQMVWSATREVGCGLASSNNKEYTFLDCRYSPPGNSPDYPYPPTNRVFLPVSPPNVTTSRITGQPTPTASSASSSTPNASGTPDASQLEQQLFEQINTDRTAHGVPDLILNPTLSYLARQHSLLISQSNCGEQDICPGEAPLQQRVDAALHQNVAASGLQDGTPTTPDAQTALLNMEKREIGDPNVPLLQTGPQQIGIGIVIKANSDIQLTEYFTYPLATTSPTAGGGTPDATQLEQQLFAQINKDRAARNLPPYTLNSTLSDVARKHSLLMSQGCGTRDDCPSEVDWAQRVNNALHQNVAGAEAVDQTTSGSNASAAVLEKEQQELSKPSTYLLHTDLQQIGIGIVIDSTGTIWLTEDFTYPLAAPTA